MHAIPMVPFSTGQTLCKAQLQEKTYQQQQHKQLPSDLNRKTNPGYKANNGKLLGCHRSNEQSI